MLKKIGLSLLLLTATLSSGAQSFSEFRKGLFEDFAKFRSSILEDYDRFLSEAWDNYQQIKGEERYDRPKPRVAPAVTPAPQTVPTPGTAPLAGKTSGALSGGANEMSGPSAEEPPAVVPAKKPKPAQPAPKAPQGRFAFPYFGMEVSVTDKAVDPGRPLASPGDYAARWRAMSKSGAEAVIPELKRVAKEFGLNDYLTFRLVRDYVAARYPEAHKTSRTALEHYLLANMGYDVRIATADGGQPLLLIPFGSRVFSRAFMNIGDTRYYVFPPDGDELNLNATISTCRLPSDADKGRPMELILRGLTLPEKPVVFNVTQGDITLTGTVNENVMNVVRHYPQMPVEDYAVSTLTPGLRESLTGQLKASLGAMKERDAVDRLLTFTQEAFEYATDQDFHGYEKPYFLEEMMYYPKCDCEDRSIFYTYMLWNVLGVENHLLGYPGHESAAVRLSEPASGSSYEWHGRRYYISDPTYIGSRTGQCMPVYQGVTPDIDYTYPSR